MRNVNGNIMMVFGLKLYAENSRAHAANHCSTGGYRNNP